MVGLTRAFVAARDELSALSLPPSRAVSVLGRRGLPLCSFVLRSLPHGAASPHSADKRRSNGIGAKEAGSNARGGGQAIRALCAQSGRLRRQKRAQAASAP